MKIIEIPLYPCIFHIVGHAMTMDSSAKEFPPSLTAGVGRPTTPPGGGATTPRCLGRVTAGAGTISIITKEKISMVSKKAKHQSLIRFSRISNYFSFSSLHTIYDFII